MLNHVDDNKLEFFDMPNMQIIDLFWNHKECNLGHSETFQIVRHSAVANEIITKMFEIADMLNVLVCVE